MLHRLQDGHVKLSDVKILGGSGLTRREALRLLLATPIAATFDVERLLWVPGQMVVVPNPSVGELVARMWEAVLREEKLDLFFNIGLSLTSYPKGDFQ